MKNIRTWLQAYSTISDQEWGELIPHLKSGRLSKREIFVMAGDQPKSIAFVTEGCLQAQYDDGTGEPRTMYFNTAQWNPVVADLHAMITGTEARFTISAVCACELVMLEVSTLQRFYDSYKSFERLGRRLAEHQYLQAMDRILNAEAEAPERYKRLVAEHPDLLKVVAAKYLASYLGVTESTLSKIKGQLLRPRSKVLS